MAPQLLRMGFRSCSWFVAMLVTSMISTHTLAQSETRAVRPFPPATVLEGTPWGRGQAYGAQFRDEIRDFLATEIYAAFVGKPSSKEHMLRYAAACGEVVRAECSLIADEFLAIADGAGLTFDEIVLLNLHEELYHRTDLAQHGHCTAVAVSPPATGNKHTYVGQTWDWMKSVAGKSKATHWRRDEGVSLLAYGFPGMPVGAGVNADGIALCWTSADLGSKGLAPRVGIPSYMLIAHLLAQRNMDDVVREARKNKHAGWFTFVIADSHGRLVNIEGSPERVVVEEADGQLARVWYGSREMSGGQLNARCKTMNDLLTRTHGKNDLARLQDYFADPTYKINVGDATIDMMVFDTTTRTAYLSRGPNYQVSWREFTLGTE